jgi:hypothetical protein
MGRWGRTVGPACPIRAAHMIPTRGNGASSPARPSVWDRLDQAHPYQMPWTCSVQEMVGGGGWAMRGGGGGGGT